MAQGTSEEKAWIKREEGGDLPLVSLGNLPSASPMQQNDGRGETSKCWGNNDMKKGGQYFEAYKDETDEKTY